MMNKQIEEMAAEVMGGCEECSKCPLAFDCKAYEYATKFYNAGYRKASEVAREIFAEIEKETEIGRIMNACAIVSLDAIAEIKQKYEVTEE
jgi:hypothetical protein